MLQHLYATVWPFDDRDLLGRVERFVITTLDAPLNLEGADRSATRLRLTLTRESLGHVSPIE
jgi:hypothetical protein